MFQTLLITFREGLEAFLIIAISLLYLTQTGRRELIPAVYGGVVAALVGSTILGIVLARVGALSPFWEAVMALIAAASVIYCTLHMMRAGKFMKKEIADGFQKTLGQTSFRSWMLAFLFSTFMVGREGVETATMIASLASQAQSTDMAIGAVIGVMLAGLLAGAWIKFGRRVDLHRFFQVTAIFMTVFALQLLLYAFHEFSEAGSLPFLDNAYWHIVTEPWGPEGDYGQWISYSLVILPVGWLMCSQLMNRRANRVRQPELSTASRGDRSRALFQ